MTRISISFFGILFLGLPAWVSAAAPDASCAQVEALIPQVEKVRGLPFREKVTCKVLNRTAFSARLAKLQNSPQSRDARKTFEAVFKIIGLIPQSFPYAGCEAATAADSSWAVYDRTNHEIVLRADVSTPDPVIAHELVHALQDQHFQLQTLQKGVKSFDQDLALSALIEGDAVNVESALPGAHSPTIGSLVNDQGSCTPTEALLNVKLFPYEWGARFANLSGNAAINEMFNHPPSTTRAVLYPKKAWNQPKLSLPLSGEPPDYRSVAADSLGEFMLRTLLKNYMAREQAILAAKGWAADRFVLYKHKSNPLYAARWNILFEDPQDVLQFRQAIKEYAAKRFGVTALPDTARWQVSAARGVSFEVQFAATSVRLDFTER